MKPCGLWQACPAEGGKEIEISVKLRRWCRKKRCSKMRSSHKYIFYFYPTWRENERGEIEEIRGSFRFFERVKDGKAAAARMGRKYDFYRQNDENLSWILALFTRKNQKSAHFSPICFFPTDNSCDKIIV